MAKSAPQEDGCLAASGLGRGAQAQHFGEGQCFVCLSLGGLLLCGKAVVSASAVLLFSTRSYLRSHTPQKESFDAFFREWFAKELLPKVAEQLEQQLVQRREALAQQKQQKGSVLSDLSSRLKTLVADGAAVQPSPRKVLRVQWYELFAEAAAPPRFSERALGSLRTATVSLGTAARPCDVTFWGINSEWYLRPKTHIDIQAVAERLVELAPFEEPEKRPEEELLAALPSWLRRS